MPRRWPTVCGATATTLYGSALPTVSGATATATECRLDHDIGFRDRACACCLCRFFSTTTTLGAPPVPPTAPVQWLSPRDRRCRSPRLQRPDSVVRTSQLAFHATCLHGCCAGSRLSHARRRVTSLCAHKSRSMRTGLLVGPLCGALDPLVGRCWAMVPLGLHLCLVKPHPRASARCVTYIGVRAFGGRVVCEAGAARGPLVRSRHKLRDGRPAVQSRPDRWSQATEEYTGGTLFCFRFVLGRTPVAIVELLGCKPFFFRGSNLVFF